MSLASISHSDKGRIAEPVSMIRRRLRSCGPHPRFHPGLINANCKLCTEMNIETVITGGEVTVEAGDDMIATGTETGKRVTIAKVGAMVQVLIVTETEGHPSMMTRTEVRVDHTQVHPGACGKLNRPPNQRHATPESPDVQNGERFSAPQRCAQRTSC
ncbi:hypothetical protein BT93_F0906 [Corymbia citriodora subsp. variegata]|nr:hypothetical protein BT93_F0906 [Corymbia citriodora subsp. variegata]KAF8023538.1 hypothetical protein BT93_F0906 [Corymbia citriodora subsp. variegata]KAF8023541.1 hypothetical protein BT93_F0906 [Corymbia citriodora subsp. variegata]